MLKLCDLASNSPIRQPEVASGRSAGGNAGGKHRPRSPQRLLKCCLIQNHHRLLAAPQASAQSHRLSAAGCGRSGKRSTAWPIRSCRNNRASSMCLRSWKHFPPRLSSTACNSDPIRSPVTAHADNVELPFRAVGRVRRLYAGLLDGLLVAAGAAVFAAVGHRMLPSLVFTKPVLLTRRRAAGPAVGGLSVPVAGLWRSHCGHADSQDSPQHLQGKIATPARASQPGPRALFLDRFGRHGIALGVRRRGCPLLARSHQPNLLDASGVAGAANSAAYRCSTSVVLTSPAGNK